MAGTRVEMFRQSIKSDWERSADLMALLANVNRNPNRRPYKAADFNRFADKPKPKPERKPTKAEIDAEREMVIAALKLKRVTVSASEMRQQSHERP